MTVIPKEALLLSSAASEAHGGDNKFGNQRAARPGVPSSSTNRRRSDLAQRLRGHKNHGRVRDLFPHGIRSMSVMLLRSIRYNNSSLHLISCSLSKAPQLEYVLRYIDPIVIVLLPLLSR